jgi:hypothetical protein
MQRCVPDVRGGVPNNLMTPHAAIADSTRQLALKVGSHRQRAGPQAVATVVADARLTNMPKFG